MAFGYVNVPGVSSAEFTAHADDKNNPHSVSKSQIDLGNVDNTSDADKPISTATQAALNKKANHSNPNLLDNWYFGDLINQRGETTYDQTGYIVDRWYLQNISEYGSLTVNSGYSTFTGSMLDGIRQFPDTPMDTNKTYTFSMLTYEGELLSISAIPPTGVKRIAFNNDWTLQFSKNYVWLPYVWNSDDEVRTINIVAIKVEEGSQQTLARRENNRWILNEPPPNKTLEFLKCQRYYFPTTSGHCFSGAFHQARKGVLFVPHSVEMKKTPTFNVLQNGSIIKETESYAITDATINVVGQDASGIKLSIETDTITTKGNAAFTDWQFEFSAEH